MQDYHCNIQNPAAVSALFAADGAIELPYLASISPDWRAEGTEAIAKMISGILKVAPDFKFSNIHFFIETPEQVFAEYEMNALFNGKPYHQLYMGRLVAEKGKIKLIREGMNMYPVLNPGK